ncbi:midnolin-like isoform X2 [Hetaerina americana]|uniref:midnolin-like isoform X2 n=1 Tax=Hetaerina americana TaxID=62018 RepID=UPI003A7F52A1
MEGGGNSGTPQSGECSKGSSNNVVGSESDLSGCGCGVTNSESSITVRVTPTTGGQFDLQVAKMETVENLKKIISKKLKVPKERICLLHRDRQLRDGTLHENQLMDGSRLTLLPSVETGLLAQRPEQSVMQALESLNDSQVNDFLSGKAPLNLTMRLGDHMMLIQLQLSTVTPSTASSSTATLPSSSRRSSASSASSRLISAASSSHHHSRSGSSTRTTPHPPPHPPPNLSFSRPPAASSSTASSSSTSTPSSAPPASSPASTHLHHPPSSSPSSATLSAPPLLGGTCAGRGLTSAHHPSSSTSSASVSSTAASSATPLCRCDASPSAHPHSVTCPLSSVSSNSASSSSSSQSPAVQAHATAAATPANSAANASTAPKPTLDTRALAEASRNLTQTLKQLSSEESTSSANRRRQGAIIESMHHHGKGVYSGTFSGTLNPALQDKFGRPKRDISTIIHILNDLLCATPQYRRHARQGHTITIETPNPSPSTQSHSSGSITSSTSGSSSRPEMMDDEEESVELSRENQATRGKMEQLRLIMEERRARRRARREARATPYSQVSSAASPGSSCTSSQWGGTVAGANYAQSNEVGENAAAINSNVPSAMDADSSTLPVSAGTATIPVSNCSSMSMGNSASVNVPGMVPLPEPPTGSAVAELQVAGRDSTPPGTGVSASGAGAGAVSDGGSTAAASGGANGSGTNSASGSGDSPMETDSSAEICELNAEPVVA